MSFLSVWVKTDKLVNACGRPIKKRMVVANILIG